MDKNITYIAIFMIIVWGIIVRNYWKSKKNGDSNSAGWLVFGFFWPFLKSNESRDISRRENVGLGLLAILLFCAIIFAVLIN